MKELGRGWIARKIASLITFKLEIEAQDEGLFTSLQTKLRSIDQLLLYSGVTKPNKVNLYL